MSKNKRKRVPKFLQALRPPPPSIRSTSERILSRSELNLHKEVEYIIKRARARDGRVVGLGQLVLFSTATGDAWMLDPEDELALCLMKGGDPQPYELGETEAKFVIQWRGRYHIEGSLFSYIPNDRPTHARVIDGYPTDAIRQTIERLRAGF